MAVETGWLLQQPTDKRDKNTHWVLSALVAHGFVCQPSEICVQLRQKEYQTNKLALKYTTKAWNNQLLDILADWTLFKEITFALKRRYVTYLLPYGNKMTITQLQWVYWSIPITWCLCGPVLRFLALKPKHLLNCVSLDAWWRTAIFSLKKLTLKGTIYNVDVKKKKVARGQNNRTCFSH